MMQQRMSAAEYRSQVAPAKRRSKYGAVRDYRCGSCGGAHVLRFDSRAEARRYDSLRQMQDAGLITDLRCQVSYDITMADKTIAKYIADFTYRDSLGLLHVLDVKGGQATRTAASRLKIKLVEAQHKITVEIVA